MAPGQPEAGPKRGRRAGDRKAKRGLVGLCRVIGPAGLKKGLCLEHSCLLGPRNAAAAQLTEDPHGLAGVVRGHGQERILEGAGLPVRGESQQGDEQEQSESGPHGGLLLILVVDPDGVYDPPGPGNVPGQGAFQLRRDLTPRWARGP